MGLEETFTQHKTVILGGAAAGVVGLALLTRRRAGGDVAAALPADQGYSAGGQVAAYDSTANDLYGALSPQLSSIANDLHALGEKKAATPTPPRPPIPVPAAPIASRITAPTRSGRYLVQGRRDDKGARAVWEQQTDGSLYHLNGSEWDQILRTKGLSGTRVEAWSRLPGVTYLEQDNIGAHFYAGLTNLETKSKGAKPIKWTTNDRGGFVRVAG